jgi:hypothetical protein
MQTDHDGGSEPKEFPRCRRYYRHDYQALAEWPNSFESRTRYREVEHEVIEHRGPRDILAELWMLEEEIPVGMTEPEALL